LIKFKKELFNYILNANIYFKSKNSRCKPNHSVQFIFAAVKTTLNHQKSKTNCHDN